MIKYHWENYELKNVGRPRNIQ